jgi:hypothetical protein
MKALKRFWKWLGKNQNTLLLVAAALGGLGGIYKFVVEPRLTASVDYTVSHLPKSYDRVVFTEKCNNVFDLMVNYASQGLKWAA